jgi:hypothetical protein
MLVMSLCRFKFPWRLTQQKCHRQENPEESISETIVCYAINKYRYGIQEFDQFTISKNAIEKNKKKDCTGNAITENNRSKRRVNLPGL